MFIKLHQKYNKTTGERYSLYKLCEGYRTSKGVYHRIIICFGRLNELETVEQKKLLAARVEELVTNGGNTLSTVVGDAKVEELARHYYSEIKQKKRYDIKQGHEDWETVNMSTIKNKDAREVGAEWLCKQAFDQLGIGNFLQQAGWEDDKISLAATHIISRAVYPAHISSYRYGPAHDLAATLFQVIDQVEDLLPVILGCEKQPPAYSSEFCPRIAECQPVRPGIKKEGSINRFITWAFPHL